MNTKLRIAFAVCAILLLVVSLAAVQATTKAARLGREAAAAQAEAAALRQQRQAPAEVPPASPAGGDDAEAWRKRANRLQEQLAENDRLIASLRQSAEAAPAPEPAGAASTNPPAEERRPGRDRGAWLEEIKQTDPQRYEEIQARRQEARERRRRSLAEQANYFLDRDTAKMDAAARAEYERMLGLLDETWRLSEQMQSDLSWEERRPLMRTLHDNMDELAPLMETERDRTFYEIGRDFGYTESEAKDFVEYLNGIIEVTSMRALFGGMHGGPGGGGDRGGGARGGEPPP